MRHIATTIAATLCLAALSPATADPLAPVTERERFVQLVAGRDLTRLGVRLRVSPEGRIEGRFFGRPVTGAWRWDAGYFCRELYLAGRDVDGTNCQVVLHDGDTLRFIADRGEGAFADLALR